MATPSRAESPGQALPRPPDRREIEHALRRHVLDVWFPRSIDREHGGFLCDFDERWRPLGAQDKLSEFQTRQTILAAEAAQAFPEERGLREAAEHGYAFLRDVLWDADSGGWFHRLDRAGAPLAHETKHAHGAIYAIEACTAVHRLTGDRDALDLAVRGFDWLRACAVDRDHGGYNAYLKRDGTPIRNEAESPTRAKVDPLGTPFGCKDVNVHSDLLESLLSLLAVHDKPEVRSAALEAFEIVATKFRTPSGGQVHVVESDWTPVPGPASYGHWLQAAFRLLAAGRLLGEQTLGDSVARGLVDQARTEAWDSDRGGFWSASVSPLAPGGRPVPRKKAWWTQFEGLRVLLALDRMGAAGAGSFASRPSYGETFASQWRFLGRAVFDERHDGVFWEASEAPRSWRERLRARFGAPDPGRRKGSPWKDASHDGRALLYCREHLVR